uniref:Uncharacterized protein n=1 Tax=Eutreptiella gymnastica TaxID=73025 RepID=A0A7S4LN06_9EUGL
MRLKIHEHAFTILASSFNHLESAFNRVHLPSKSLKPLSARLSIFGPCPTAFHLLLFDISIGSLSALTTAVESLTLALKGPKYLPPYDRQSQRTAVFLDTAALVCLLAWALFKQIP